MMKSVILQREKMNGEREYWQDMPGAIADICGNEDFERDPRRRELSMLYEALQPEIKSGEIEGLRPNTGSQEFIRKCETYPAIEKACYDIKWKKWVDSLADGGH